MTVDAPDLVKLRPTLRRLGVSRTTYYKLVKLRRWPIKPFRFSFDSCVRFRRADVEAFLASGGVVGQATPSRTRRPRHASRVRIVE